MILPSDITGVEFWLKGAFATGFEDGEHVGEYVDKSRAENNAVQPTISAQPAFVENVLDGQPGFVFDGGDYLTVPGVVNNRRNRTIFSVARLTGGGGFSRGVWGLNQFVQVQEDTTWNYYGTGAAAGRQNLGGSTANFTAIAVRLEGNTVGTAWRNGEAPVTFDPFDTVGNTADTLLIGAQTAGGSKWIGPIPELIVFDHLLTDAEVQEVLGYLNAEYPSLGEFGIHPVWPDTSEVLVEAHEPWITDDLGTYLRVLGSMFAEVELYAFDTDEDEGWTILLDVDRAPYEALPYLAQYVGERLPRVEIPDAMARQWIRDAPNQVRGTLDSIVIAAKRYLTGAKAVTIIERDAGNPDRIAVVSYTDQTPDSAKVLAELLTTVPADITLAYTVSAGQTWSQVVATKANWTAVLSSYATWQDVIAATPSGTY